MDEDEMILRCFALLAAAVSRSGITEVDSDRPRTVIADARHYEAYLREGLADA